MTQPRSNGNDPRLCRDEDCKLELVRASGELHTSFGRRRYCNSECRDRERDTRLAAHARARFAAWQRKTEAERRAALEAAQAKERAWITARVLAGRLVKLEAMQADGLPVFDYAQRRKALLDEVRTHKCEKHVQEAVRDIRRVPLRSEDREAIA